MVREKEEHKKLTFRHTPICPIHLHINCFLSHLYLTLSSSSLFLRAFSNNFSNILTLDRARCLEFFLLDFFSRVCMFYAISFFVLALFETNPYNFIVLNTIVSYFKDTCY